MSRASGKSSPHKTFRRRLRRRSHLNGISAVVCLMYLAPTLCILAWLGPDWGLRWLAYLMACLWFLLSAVIVFGSLAALQIQTRKDLFPVQKISVPTHLLYLIGNAITAICLLLGRFDAAVYAFFGMMFLSSLIAYRRFSPSAILSILGSAGILIAYAQHIVWLVAALLILQGLVLVFWFLTGLPKPSLREAIAEKPTRGEYIIGLRKQCVAGVAWGPLRLLDALCDAQLWEEALLELKRQSYVPEVKRKEIVWLARIHLGMGRNEEVIALEERSKQDARDISSYLAVAYARLGHKGKALRTAQEALRVRRPSAYRAMGDVYFVLKDYDKALFWYERAKDWLRMSETLTALGDEREACIVYEQAIRFASFVRAKDLLRLAECLRKNGQARTAAEAEQLAHERAE